MRIHLNFVTFCWLLTKKMINGHFLLKALLFLGCFGSVEWNEDETHLLYVAEQKEPKTKNFLDKKPNENKSEKVLTLTLPNL